MTATPRVGAPELVAGQAIPETTVNQQALLWDAFSCPHIINRTTATPPVSPAQGDMYLVAASPTGAWVGQAGNIALYTNTSWTFVAVKAGFLLWVDAENVFARYDGAAWANLATALLRLIASFFTSTPTASEVLCLYVAADAFTIAANMAGTQVKVGTNPTATFAIDVQQNGTSIGTISISTGGVVTLTTVGGTSKSVAIGDVIKLVAPSTPDTTIANAAINIKGTV